MSDLALVTANKTRVVGLPIDQYTMPTGEAFTAGQVGRIDVSTGKATKSNATTLAEGRAFGIATRTPEATGLGLTFLRKGYFDGFDLSGLAYDALVYLSDTDGALADSPGTKAIAVGRVVPAFAAGLNSPDKILEVDFTQGNFEKTETIEVSFTAVAVADQVDRYFFVANRPYQVVAARYVFTVQESAGTLNVQLTRCQGTEAPSAGDALLTNNTNAGFNAVTTAATVQVGTLTATEATLQLDTGDRLALDFTGDVAGELAGSTITVQLKAI